MEKTSSVMDFAHENYKHVVYLNFYENSNYAAIFGGSLETYNIIMMISATLDANAVIIK